MALASGTLVTVYQKRHGDRIPLVWGTAVQYAAAAAVLLAVAVATEDMSIRWTDEFVAAFVWLVLVLSIGAVLLLGRGTAAGVSSLYYLVPWPPPSRPTCSSASGSAGCRSWGSG